MRNLRYFSKGLQGASLIVSMHDCHQNSLVVDGSFYIVGIDTSISIDGEVGYTKPVQACEGSTDMKYRRVLSYLRDNMVPTLLR